MTNKGILVAKTVGGFGGYVPPSEVPDSGWGYFLSTTAVNPGGGANIIDERPNFIEDTNGVLWRVSTELYSGNSRLLDSRIYITAVGGPTGVTLPANPILIDTTTGTNNHFHPSVDRLPNGNPVVIYTKHNGTDVWQVTPDDPDDFTAGWTSTNIFDDLRGVQTGIAYTYSSFARAPNITTPALFWFTRKGLPGNGNSGNQAYSKNTGAGWAPTVDFINFTARPYRVPSADEENGIVHFGISPANPGDIPTSAWGIYYLQMKLESETFHATSAGSALTLPITDPAVMTEIYQQAGQTSWIMDTRHYPNGDVCFAFWTTPTGFAEGNELVGRHARLESDGTITVTTLGTIWELVVGLRGIPGMALDPLDSNVLYMGEERTAGIHGVDTQQAEFYKWTLSDGTWTKGEYLANLEYGHGIDAAVWQDKTILSITSGVAAPSSGQFVNPRRFESGLFDRIGSTHSFLAEDSISSTAKPWIVPRPTGSVAELYTLYPGPEVMVYDPAQPESMHPPTSLRVPASPISNGDTILALRDANNVRWNTAGSNADVPKPTWNSAGYLQFDGTQGLQVQGNLDDGPLWGGGAYFFAMRVRFNTIPASSQLFCHHYATVTNPTRLAFQCKVITDGAIQFAASRTNSAAVVGNSATGVVTTGQWYTIGFSATAGSNKAFVDGTEVLSVAHGGDMRTMIWHMTIGARATDSSNNQDFQDFLDGDVAGVFMQKGSYPGDTERDAIFTRLSTRSPA